MMLETSSRPGVNEAPPESETRLAAELQILKSCSVTE